MAANDSIPLTSLNGEICERILNAKALVDVAGRLVHDLIESTEMVDEVVEATRILEVASDCLRAAFETVDANLRPETLNATVKAEAANG